MTVIVAEFTKSIENVIYLKFIPTQEILNSLPNSNSFKSLFSNDENMLLLGLATTVLILVLLVLSRATKCRSIIEKIKRKVCYNALIRYLITSYIKLGLKFATQPIAYYLLLVYPAGKLLFLQLKLSKLDSAKYREKYEAAYLGIRQTPFAVSYTPLF